MKTNNSKLVIRKMFYYINILNCQNIEYIFLSVILWVTLSFNQSIHIWACYISHLTFGFVQIKVILRNWVFVSLYEVKLLRIWPYAVLTKVFHSKSTWNEYFFIWKTKENQKPQHQQNYMSYRSYTELQNYQYITYRHYFRDYQGLFFVMH